MITCRRVLGDEALWSIARPEVTMLGCELVVGEAGYLLQHLVMTDLRDDGMPILEASATTFRSHNLSRGDGNDRVAA